MIDPASSSKAGGILTRDAKIEDIAAIAAIYAYYVRTSAATFESVPPDAAEMSQRFSDLNAKKMPFLVAEKNNQVVGYAYAGPYRTRWGYRYTVENSVYVDRDYLGQGIGRMLLSSLIERATQLGYRQMISVIGDSANAASIALHSQLGFKVIGSLPSTGRKFDRWIDSVLMQRALGDGNTTSPPDVNS